MKVQTFTLSNIQKARKLAIAIIGLAALAFAASRSPYWPEGTAVHDCFSIGGIALILAAILGRCWCSLYISGRKKSELVTSGPYSLCRNPLYVFNVTGAAGIGLLSGSLSVGILFGFLAFLIFNWVIRREESYLETAFGEDFRHYRRATPRWRPSPDCWRDEDLLQVRPRLALITLRDSSSFLLFWPLFELLQHFQNTGMITSGFVLP